MPLPATQTRPSGSGKERSPSFHYRRLGPAELPLLNQLYNGHYGKNRPLDEAVWLYKNNPNGAAVIYAAFDANGELAGMRPSIPFTVWWRGRERMAFEFADALVNTRYQGRGIFSRLVRTACEWAEQEGHTLFSLPNENSLSVYRRIPGLQVLGDSRTVAKPLSWLAYLRHHLNPHTDPAPGAPVHSRARSFLRDGDVGLRPVERFESDFAEVHEALRRKGLSFTLRTKDFLQWRYFGSPVRKYQVALVEQAQGIRGYLVIRVISGIAHIVDFFLDPDGEVARRAFRLAAKWAKAMGAIGIHYSCAGNSLFLDAAARGGYWLKKRSRRLVVNRASTQLADQSANAPLRLDDVYLVMGDFDFL